MKFTISNTAIYITDFFVILTLNISGGLLPTMIVEILLTLAQVVVFLYDLLTYPVYKALARLQAERREKSSTPRAFMVRQSSQEVSWRREKSQENVVYKEYIIDNKVRSFTLHFPLYILTIVMLSGGHGDEGIQLRRGQVRQEELPGNTAGPGRN